VAEISAKKLNRGQGKIKLAGRICGRILAEFYQKWQKGAGEYCIKKFLIYWYRHTFRDKDELELNFELTLRAYVEFTFLSNWPNFFQNWPNFFVLLAGKQFRDLATLALGVKPNPLQ
jgi:hypothetical protein